jgi:phosphoglycerate dehydrogenase-like enzyme
MNKYPTLFITHRGERHQQSALDAAPATLDITMKRSPSKEEIIALLPGKEFLITERTGVIDADIIAAGKDLRLIQRLGSQSYDIDLHAARNAGVPVCYMSIRSCVMVAEHMSMQILALARRLRENMQIAVDAGDWGTPLLCDEDTFAYNWSDRKGVRGLFESTVGIIGFGEIGTELAKRLKNFDCTLLYNKRSRLPETAEAELNMNFSNLDELLANSDFVCMLPPYFPETHQMVNADFLQKMKTGAYLVSCGGSGIFDEDAVAEALKVNKLSGAATDTFVYEPIHPENPLLPLARKKGTNIILTPHIGSGTDPATATSRSRDFTNLENVLNNQPLRFQLV